MSGDLFEQSTKPILVIGIGSLGGRVASAGSDEADVPASVAWCAAGFNPAELIATGLERKLCLPQAEGPFAEQALERMVLEKESELRALAAGRSVAVLVCSLGEPGMGLLAAQLSAALRAHLFVCVIACDAFAFEGPGNAVGMDAVAASIHGEASLFIRLPAAALTGDIPGDRGLAGSRAEIQNRLVSIMHAVVGAFAAGSIDPERLENALRNTHVDQISLGFGAGPAAPMEAAESALGSLESNNSSGIIVLLAAGRELVLSEAEALRTRLHDAAADQSAVLGLVLQPQRGDEALSLVLACRASRSNVVPLSSATVADGLAR